MNAILPVVLKIILVLHVVCGITTLVAGPVAIYANLKNKKLHRFAGKAFFFAMNFVCISAIVGYFKHPNQVFYAFLLGIAVFVYVGILRGVRAIKLMKGGKVLPFDFIYTALGGLFGAWMVGMGIWHYFHDKEIIFTVLFSAFGVAVLRDVLDNFKHFLHPERYNANDWMRWHFFTMIGALVASTTAFTVNIGGDVLPWYAQWFGPTILLVPLQVYWGRKTKEDKLTSTTA